MQRLPLLHQRIVSIHKERVIKLLAQLFFQRPEAGEIHHETAGIQPSGGKPERETAAVAMHEAAMARVLPLPVTTRIALKLLAASERNRRLRTLDGCRMTDQGRTLAASNAAPLIHHGKALHHGGTLRREMKSAGLR